MRDTILDFLGAFLAFVLFVLILILL